MPLYSTVKSLLDGGALSSGARNYHGTAPQSPGKPYTVMSAMTTPENTLSSGAVKANTRQQIDCYADTFVAAKALAEAVKVLMTANDFAILLLEVEGIYESDVKLHRVTQDYSIWA